MNTNDKSSVALGRATLGRRHWALKVLSLGMVLVGLMNLVTVILPWPRVEVMSDTAYRIIRAKNLARTYLSPVGWVALLRGYNAKSIYQLEWDGPLAFGQWVGVFGSFALARILWMRGRQSKRE